MREMWQMWCCTTMQFSHIRDRHVDNGTMPPTGYKWIRKTNASHLHMLNHKTVQTNGRIPLLWSYWRLYQPLHLRLFQLKTHNLWLIIDHIAGVAIWRPWIYLRKSTTLALRMRKSILHYITYTDNRMYCDILINRFSFLISFYLRYHDWICNNISSLEIGQSPRPLCMWNEMKKDINKWN